MSYFFLLWRAGLLLPFAMQSGVAISDIAKVRSKSLNKFFIFRVFSTNVLKKVYSFPLFCVFRRIKSYFCAVKKLLVILGSLSLGLGVLGIFVPLLPTTPLLLLAAALYFKGSPRLYEWLINHPRLGEYIRNFREHRAIPLRAKVVSVSLLWLTIGYCIVAVVDKWWWAQALMALLAVAVTWHILSFSTLKK